MQVCFTTRVSICATPNYFQICVDGFLELSKGPHIEGLSPTFTRMHTIYPPRWVGVTENKTEEQQLARKKVDEGPWFDLHDTLFDESELDDDAKNIALERMLLFKSNVINANPMKSEFDAPLRQALTLMMTGDKCESTAHTLDNDQIAQSLRYLRDRINVPRDMPIYSGRYMREALEEVASMYSSEQGFPRFLQITGEIRIPLSFTGKKLDRTINDYAHN